MEAASVMLQSPVVREFLLKLIALSCASLPLFTVEVLSLGLTKIME